MWPLLHILIAVMIYPAGVESGAPLSSVPEPPKTRRINVATDGATNSCPWALTHPFSRSAETATMLQWPQQRAMLPPLRRRPVNRDSPPRRPSYKRRLLLVACTKKNKPQTNLLTDPFFPRRRLSMCGRPASRIFRASRLQHDVPLKGGIFRAQPSSTMLLAAAGERRRTVELKGFIRFILFLVSAKRCVRRCLID